MRLHRPEFRTLQTSASRISPAVLATCLVWVLAPFGAATAAPEVIRCFTVPQILPEITVLPDGSREARLSFGNDVYCCARDRIPSALCEQECLLTLRLADTRLEKHRIAGEYVAVRTLDAQSSKGRPRYLQIMHFRLRPFEWVAVGVFSRRERSGRLTYEEIGTSVHLENASPSTRLTAPDLASIDLKRTAVCAECWTASDESRAMAAPVAMPVPTPADAAAPAAPGSPLSASPNAIPACAAKGSAARATLLRSPGNGPVNLVFANDVQDFCSSVEKNRPHRA